MPAFHLVIVTAPKLALMSTEGDIIVHQTSITHNSALSLSNGARASPDSKAKAQKDIDRIFMHSISDDSLPKKAAQSQYAVRREYIDGRVLEDVNSENIAQEIDVKHLLTETLDCLYNTGHMTTRPCIMEDESRNFIQTMITCEKGQSLDVIVSGLLHIGVGTLVGNINVVPLETSKFYKPALYENKAESDVEKQEIDKEKGNYQASELEKKLFMEAASHLRVEQVVETIKNASALSFDYLSLLTIASVIAGIGLASNNSIAIVASMLVSPIMGPVLALAFGSIIHDKKLSLLGLRNECLSLLLCMFIGFIIGIISVLIGTGHSWPTDEMKSRGILNGLAVGLAIAIPSGVGVALSVLRNDTSSLVGVAISASLLPPAVNCGIALAYAAVGFELDPHAVDNEDHRFSSSQSYYYLAAISFALTLTNIGAIFLSALVMFRIKEVAPIQNKKAFWHEDIQISRHTNLYPAEKHNAIVRQKVNYLRQNTPTIISPTPMSVFNTALSPFRSSSSTISGFPEHVTVQTPSAMVGTAYDVEMGGIAPLGMAPVVPISGKTVAKNRRPSLERSAATLNEIKERFKRFGHTVRPRSPSPASTLFRSVNT